ncbi:class I SAM-dependent methyltransferase [Nonomuraea spiralis]|uniref:class I SAM-dependent methyltransferase n=1 Tax=Nonomuraea spiralis TaxID=46182 RepID=UPI00379AFCF4
MRASYLPSLTLDEYLRVVATVHPQLHAVLDFERPGAARALGVLAATSSEFDSDRGGRGDSYRRAQQDALVRWTGIRALLGLLAPDPAAGPPLLLDVLGGDGTVARAAAGRLGSLDSKPTIITGDLSGQMVDRALAQGLPAVRQAAQFLFLRAESVDGVLLAYGTHHIDPADRPRAVAEAVRVTRPGGRIVLHDFDDDGPMAGFFARVVHPHAAGGHAYRHFTRSGLAALFADAGLAVRVLDLYDPLVVRAGGEPEAKERMCRYVGDMYGVGAHFAALEDVEAAWRLLERHFDHGTPRHWDPSVPSRPVVHRRDGMYVAEVPRMALVAVATKPATPARRLGDQP